MRLRTGTFRMVLAVLAVVLGSIVGVPGPAGAAGASLFVAIGGNDVGNCQASASPCATISYAVTQASTGDTINVGPGIFSDNVVIEGGLTDLTISGAGSGSTIIDGGGSSPVLVVFGGVSVTGLTIEHGGGAFGGVVNEGTLGLTTVAVTGNATTGNGGGITNVSVLTVTDSSITDNTTSGGGAGLLNESGTATLTNDTISGNTGAPLGGGGLGNEGGATLTVTSSTVSGNSSSHAGSGIFNIGATVILTKDTISDNTGAPDGGGGIVNVNDPGGAVGSLSVSMSTINGNTASGGAGLLNAGSTATLTDDTVSDNSAGAGGGGALGNEANGASPGQLTVSASTIVDNNATAGAGGIVNFDTASVSGTIIADNETANCVGGVTTDVGYNLSNDNGADCNLTAGTDVLDVDPDLGPLRDNGGATLTRALAPGSPAVDKIPQAEPAFGCPGTDQRGVVRPQGNACDIGAVELALPKAQGQSDATPENTTLVEPVGSLQTGASDANPGPVTLTAAGPATGPAHGTATVNANGSFTYTPAAGFFGTDSFTFTLSDQYGFTSFPATVTITVGTCPAGLTRHILTATSRTGSFLGLFCVNASGSGTYQQGTVHGTGTIVTAGGTTRITAFGTNLALIGQTSGASSTFTETAPPPARAGTFTLS
jgi:hypothetical protein